MRNTWLRWMPFLGALHRIVHGARTRWSEWLLAWKSGLRTEWINRVLEPGIQRMSDRSPESRSPAPVVHLYAVCWNEERILPWFLDHYGSVVSEFHIYDNGSTDSSLQLLSDHPDVTIHPYDTGGAFDDAANMNIKNNAWKASIGKADYVVVCDMDEFLYHPNLRMLLALMKARRYTVLKPHGVQMVSERLPPHDGRHSLVELISTGVPDEHNYSKSILFDPNRVDIHFGPGCHRSRPEGRVKVYRSDLTRLLHFKYVDREEVLRKTRVYREKFSEENRAKGWGRHYQKSDEEMMAVFDRMLASGEKMF